ncbi:MAG: alpha/beta hydrolase, partial [Actinomycetota bacterium]
RATSRSFGRRPAGGTVPRSLHRPLLAMIVIAVLAAACSRVDRTTETSPAPASTTTASTTTDAAAAVTSASASADPASASPVADEREFVVYGDAEFDVAVTNDVVYAQALSHESWGSDEAKTIDLLLDVYEPVRDDDVVMPAVVMIHGGGFTGGSKEHQALSDMAYWFAERGWVAYSINYRLAGDIGTLPADYPVPPAEANAKQQEQVRALYPACRDAKAAIRWVKATADDYSIDPELVSVVGGSAGSNLAITLGVSDEGDCTDDISLDDDPTLATTNLDQSSSVATVIDHWGGSAVLTIVEMLESGTRFDATDAPMSIVHGTEDPTVAFSEAERLRAAYDETGVPYAWHPLEGKGHSAWGATIDGRPLVESAADFIITIQDLELS